MSRRLIVVAETRPIAEALARAREAGVRDVVVARAGIAVGTASVRDLKTLDLARTVLSACRPLRPLSITSPLARAADVLAGGRTLCVPVVDDAHCICGLVNEAVLARAA